MLAESRTLMQPLKWPPRNEKATLKKVAYSIETL